MSQRIAICAFFAWICSSCVFISKPDPAPGGNHPRRTLRLWVDRDPRLDRALTVAACNRWNVMNVTCVDADSIGASDVRVSIDGRDCRQRDDKGELTGSFTLAEAYRDGRVRMMWNCLNKDGAGFEAHQYGAVFAHEIGHELGIWEHVAATCDANAPKHRGDGKPICGPALLNAYYHKEISFVTAIDALAYDERETDLKAVPDKMEDADPSCVYTAPAP